MCIRDRLYALWAMTFMVTVSFRPGSRAATPAISCVSPTIRSVSYTHLDVYKRQVIRPMACRHIGEGVCSIGRSSYAQCHCCLLYTSSYTSSHSLIRSPLTYNFAIASSLNIFSIYSIWFFTMAIPVSYTHLTFFRQQIL